MVRIARIVLPRRPHLVAQRGNRSERLFFSADDRGRYLEILSEQLARHGVKLWAYRLEADEVLLVLVPPDDEAMAQALRNAHGRYSQMINRRQGTTGHLFQGRFYSCPLDAEHLALAVRYLERFGGRRPPGTKSSAAYHCGRAGGAGGLLADDLPLLKAVRNWRKWLAEPIDRAALKHLLSRLRVGKQAGSPAFVRKVEKLTGMNLSRRPGRPRKDRR
jgi:putative transposase